MVIVRVGKEPSKEYHIYYVSDNCFADGYLYRDFLSKLRKTYEKEHIITSVGDVKQ